MPGEGRRWLVRGRVQGVGFRYFVQREAAALALAGWVRNLADGGVEVYAWGPAAALDALQGRLWLGPRLADVRQVEPQSAPEHSGDGNFNIR